MRKLAFAVVIVGCLAVEPGSAATYPTYFIHGGSCTAMTRPDSERGLAVVALPHVSKYGVNADLWAIDVTCPLVLPLSGPKSLFLRIFGYNRSPDDPLSCRVTSTDSTGVNSSYAQVTLRNNSPSSQNGLLEMNLVFGTLLYVTCHLPAQSPSGPSHLTFMLLSFSDEVLPPRRGQTPVSP